MADNDTLVVVESPAKAKTIGKYLGKGYTVKATVGHIRDLPERELGVDIEKDFKPKFVTVASKIPQSIEVQLCAPKTARVTGQFGSVEETVHVKHGQTYIIRGTSYPSGQAPKGFPRRAEMIEDQGGGYALTHKIPADFWDEWLRQNADTEMVKNHLLIAHADVDDLASDAADFAKVDSGLGPLNPDGDRRNPKPANSGVAPLQPDDRRASA